MRLFLIGGVVEAATPTNTAIKARTAAAATATTIATAATAANEQQRHYLSMLLNTFAQGEKIVDEDLRRRRKKD